jgi:hypothetical protein
MEKWHIAIIKKAFSRCWGLQKLVIEAVGSEDTLLMDGITHELSHQTGFTEKFIKDNIKTISEL